MYVILHSSIIYVISQIILYYTTGYQPVSEWSAASNATTFTSETSPRSLHPESSPCTPRICTCPLSPRSYLQAPAPPLSPRIMRAAGSHDRGRKRRSQGDMKVPYRWSGAEHQTLHGIEAFHIRHVGMKARLRPPLLAGCLLLHSQMLPVAVIRRLSLGSVYKVSSFLQTLIRLCVVFIEQ